MVNVYQAEEQSLQDSDHYLSFICNCPKKLLLKNEDHCVAPLEERAESPVGNCAFGKHLSLESLTQHFNCDEGVSGRHHFKSTGMRGLCNCMEAHNPV